MCWQLGKRHLGLKAQPTSQALELAPKLPAMFLRMKPSLETAGLVCNDPECRTSCCKNGLKNGWIVRVYWINKLWILFLFLCYHDDYHIIKVAECTK